MKKYLVIILALMMLLLGACAKEVEPHSLLQLSVKESEGGTLTLDHDEIWAKDEKVVLTLKPEEGYVPYGLYFYNEQGVKVTATYPETDEFAVQADGSYRVEFEPAQYYHVHEAGEEDCDAHEEGESHIAQGKVEADFISEDAPVTTVAQVHEHSQITVFPGRCEKGTNVKIVIALEKGYEVTHCDHNGTEFPVDEPLATYSDAQFDYVSFSFYMKDADEVVTYEIAQK